MSLQDKLTSQTNYTQYSTQEVSLFQGYTKELKLTIPVAYTDGTYKLRTVIKAGTVEGFSSSSPDLVNFETTITSADTTITLLSGHTVNIPVGDAVMDLIITKSTTYIPYGRYSVSCLKSNYASGSSVIPPASLATAGQVLYVQPSGITGGIDTASGTPISATNKPADKAYADTKVSKSGDTINGVFQNSTTPKTQIILNGTNAGDNADGTPNTNSSPRVELSTYQYSEYASGEAQKGGFSELVRLVSKDTQAKPTLAFYDHNYNPVGWLVAHFHPQDLRIYANLASFPATGVNDGLRAYFAEDTGKYYTWNGSAYVELTSTNADYYFRAIHQHFSIETSDTTGNSNYTRLAVPYNLDIAPITTSNAHFRITGGTKNSKPGGAFIVDEGKMFSLNPIAFYPNSSNAGTVETWKDNATDNIFANNTKGLRLRVLASGNAENLVSGQDVVAMNAEGVNFLEVNENLIVGGSSAYSLGVNRSPGVTLDVRRDLGNANNTEYNVARISRDENSFLNLGYRGDGSGVGAYMMRATGNKDVILGTTGDNVALTVKGSTGNVEINKPTTVHSLTITNDTSKPNIGLVNGRLAVSVASGSLTISVVGNNGSTPSATNKVEIWLPDAGAIFTKKVITSALSLTMASGTNWMDLASTMNRDKKVNLAVYIGINDSGDVFLGAGRLYGVTKGTIFNNTTTSYKYARFTGGENPANISAMTSVGRVAVQMNSSNEFVSLTANNENIIQYPIYSSGTMNWTPTYGASGSMTYTSVTTGTASYTMHNSIITYNIMARGTTGGTAAKRLTVSIPIIYDTGSAPSFPVGVLRSGCYVRDAADSAGYVNIDSQSTVMEFGLNGEVDWSLDNGKDVGVEISFPIY